MASTYGDNFGFRRSSENFGIHEGNYKTPAGGSFLRQGSAVMRDVATDEYMKVATANAVPTAGGSHGLLVQEEDHIPTIYDLPGRTTDNYGLAKKNTRSVMWSGAGTKVWFKNTPQKTSFDGTVIDAVTMWTPTSVVVGAYLKWNGTVWVLDHATTPTSAAWMKVTSVTDTKVEAILIF